MPRIDPWATPITTLQNAATANGNGTEMSITGLSSMAVQITGTFSATINFEVTVDGVNWIAILGQNVNTGSQSTSAMAPGIYTFALNGLSKFRARISGYVSGSVTVVGVGSALPLAALSSAIINATVDAVKIKDATGTNTLAIGADGTVPVTLYGSILETSLLTNTPLAAGSSWNSGVLSNPKGAAVGILLTSDTLVTVRVLSYDSTSSNVSLWSDYNYRLVVDSTSMNAVFLPPVRLGPAYSITLENPTPTAQTVLKAYQVRQYGGIANSQSTRVCLAKGLAIRDTSGHSPFTDIQYCFFADLARLGRGPFPIFVKNTLNQQITVSIRYTAAASVEAELGNFTVAAGATALKTNTEFPGLDIPVLRMYLVFTAAAQPTSGDVQAWTVVSVGG